VALQQASDMTIATPGAVISGLEIHGTLRVEAANVTIRDCRIVNDGGYHGILIQNGTAVVEFCDIIGPQNGISGAGTFRSNDISKVENGINVYGASLIQDNYIHDMSYGGAPHYDGIEINGGGGTTISHNTVINTNSQTSAVMIDNYFGPISNITVDNNLLIGGAYTIFVDGQFSGGSVTGVKITNNRLGKGDFGYLANTQTNPVFTGNVDNITGQPI
jgi:hypothetical protein